MTNQASHLSNSKALSSSDITSDSITELRSRINELEMQLSYTDDTVDQLNKLVTAQTLELEQIKKQIQLMALKIKGMEQSEGSIAPFVPEQNVPPHY